MNSITMLDHSTMKPIRCQVFASGTVGDPKPVSAEEFKRALEETEAELFASEESERPSDAVCSSHMGNYSFDCRWALLAATDDRVVRNIPMNALWTATWSGAISFEEDDAHRWMPEWGCKAPNLSPIFQSLMVKEISDTASEDEIARAGYALSQFFGKGTWETPGEIESVTRSQLRMPQAILDSTNVVRLLVRLATMYLLATVEERAGRKLVVSEPVECDMVRIDGVEALATRIAEVASSTEFHYLHVGSASSVSNVLFEKIIIPVMLCACNVSPPFAEGCGVRDMWPPIPRVRLWSKFEKECEVKVKVGDTLPSAFLFVAGQLFGNAFNVSYLWQQSVEFVYLFLFSPNKHTVPPFGTCRLRICLPKLDLRAGIVSFSTGYDEVEQRGEELKFHQRCWDAVRRSSFLHMASWFALLRLGGLRGLRSEVSGLLKISGFGDDSYPRNFATAGAWPVVAKVAALAGMNGNVMRNRFLLSVSPDLGPSAADASPGKIFRIHFNTSLQWSECLNFVKAVPSDSAAMSIIAPALPCDDEDVSCEADDRVESLLLLEGGRDAIISEAEQRTQIEQSRARLAYVTLGVEWKLGAYFEGKRHYLWPMELQPHSRTQICCDYALSSLRCCEKEGVEYHPIVTVDPDTQRKMMRPSCNLVHRSTLFAMHRGIINCVIWPDLQCSPGSPGFFRSVTREGLLEDRAVGDLSNSSRSTCDTLSDDSANRRSPSKRRRVAFPSPAQMMADDDRHIGVIAEEDEEGEDGGGCRMDREEFVSICRSISVHFTTRGSPRESGEEWLQLAVAFLETVVDILEGGCFPEGNDWVDGWRWDCLAPVLPSRRFAFAVQLRELLRPHLDLRTTQADATKYQSALVGWENFSRLLQDMPCVSIEEWQKWWDSHQEGGPDIDALYLRWKSVLKLPTYPYRCGFAKWINKFAGDSSVHFIARRFNLYQGGSDSVKANILGSLDRLHRRLMAEPRGTCDS
eukprot:GHVU01224584.1.p1 GENE.GHVU01224584.1~~GHVU01224584.1.p1  ORF type:complete len:974 (+),score=120.40 GHVU01224584.1:468-3389(+)